MRCFGETYTTIGDSRERPALLNSWGLQILKSFLIEIPFWAILLFVGVCSYFYCLDDK
jgi:hypothetical protein